MVLKRPKRKDFPPEPVLPEPVLPEPVLPEPIVSGDTVSSERRKMVRCAKENLGKPYVWGTHGPDSFDCSGLVGFCYKQATGKDIGYGSVAQFNLGKKVDVADAKPGDVFFWDTFGEAPGHNAIYIGNDTVIHAFNENEGVVQTENVSQKNMGGNGRFMGVRDFGFAAAPDVDTGPVVTPGYIIGSYGVPSIDQWDKDFIAGSDAVFAQRNVRVNPRFIKAMMDVETDERKGDYPPDACRPCDGEDCVPACGPMQIKFPYHEKRCPTCRGRGTPGHIEMAFHIIGMTMLERNVDEFGAFLAVYFPTDDINGTTQNAYVKKIKSNMRKMEQDAAGPGPVITPDPKPTIDPWRPYPYPKMVDLLVTKPGEGAGFDRVPFRRPNIRGFCTHITDGPPSQSIEFFRDFFSTGGARAWDALTDLVIGWDGRIGVLNDWRDPDRGGRRAGWANGGVDGLEGEGIAFYRAFPSINVSLVSCEHAQKAGGAWSDAMIASTIEIRTAIAQEQKCPWDKYPFHPAYGGVSIEQQHRNFATKSCPANPYINTYDAIVRAEVKAKLKAWQGGIDTGPIVTPPDVLYTRFGFDENEIAKFFGTITRENRDGTVDQFGFDKNGALSLMWLNRCDAEGKFPEAETIWFADAEFVKGEEMWASWEGGWIAYLPLVDSRASWMWLDAKAA